ncbi:hypothetical protein G5B38_06155 [Pseudohalocynthiibacter aestuariivivens]|nr:hypothetical protein [Pseudohalocynthiibacter aestuariivivens]QIE45145.1 hypothetical protein G5B38_06155 [Pseudohalocynthiibacter aestuariivivens]
MIDQDRFGHDITALMETLRAKLGARGSSLHKRLRRAGRRLPKSGHRAGQVLTEAERWMAHPKLRARLDAGKIDAALTEINRQLEDVDPVDARKDMLLGMAGGLVFNLMIAVAVLIAVLRWRGLV